MYLVDPNTDFETLPAKGRVFVRFKDGQVTHKTVRWVRSYLSYKSKYGLDRSLVAWSMTATFNNQTYPW